MLIEKTTPPQITLNELAQGAQAQQPASGMAAVEPQGSASPMTPNKGLFDDLVGGNGAAEESPIDKLFENQVKRAGSATRRGEARL